MIESLAGDNSLLPTPIGGIDNRHPGVIVRRQLSPTQEVGCGPTVLKDAHPVVGESPTLAVHPIRIATTKRNANLTTLTAS